VTDDEAEIFGPIDPELSRRAAEIRAARVTKEGQHQLVGYGAPPTSLSARHLQVLELIADGDSNQEIADKLCIALDTVKSHVKTMLQILDARNRAHLVGIAYRR
jgi:DNA-binding CsgD family transcriptional regulator